MRTPGESSLRRVLDHLACSLWITQIGEIGLSLNDTYLNVRRNRPQVRVYICPYDLGAFQRVLNAFFRHMLSPRTGNTHSDQDRRFVFEQHTQEW